MVQSEGVPLGATSQFKTYTAPVRIMVALFSVYVMTIAATIGYTFILAPFAIVMFINLHAYETITNFMISTWLVLPPVLNQIFFGTKLRVFGSPEASKMFPAGVPQSGWNLFIMNHRTRLDWYYIWLAFLKSTNAFTMAQMFKIVLKSSLSKIPGYGWSMQMSRFLFLNRAWDKDREHMDTYSSMVVDHAVPHSLLIFPEGTDYEPKSLRSSHSFAKKNNLPQYSYVLHPRITGTVHLMQQLIKGKSLERVVNITAYYPDFIPCNEFSLLLGIVPKEVWYFVEVIPLSEIPGASQDDTSGESSEEIGEWLKELWREKEDILTSLYEGPHHNSNHNNNNNVESQVVQNGHAMSEHDKLTQNGEAKYSSMANGESEKRKWQEVREKETLASLRYKFVEYTEGEGSTQLKTVHYVLFVWWSIFSVISVYGVWNSVPAQVVGLIVTAITLFVNLKYGGWDYLEMSIHKQRIIQQHKTS